MRCLSRKSKPKHTTKTKYVKCFWGEYAAVKRNSKARNIKIEIEKGKFINDKEKKYYLCFYKGE